MELIDRHEERQRLVEAADQPPQLVIMRGRRRVGKSFLTTHAFQGRRMLFFQADEQDQTGHLELLAREAADLLPGRPPLRFDDWDRALGFLGDQAAHDPLVVVLDEFQWLWAAQPALDSLIQRHWDRWQRAGTALTLILSGSSLIHMERLLEPNRPLFGRANYRPLIAPLDFRWAAAFASTGATPEDLLRRYAVLGGTPQYQVWAGKGSLLDIIERRILAKGESLYEEPLHLLREEQTIRTPGSYFDVMRAIASGSTRFNEIALHTGLTGPIVHPMIARLVALGYVEQRAPLESAGFAQRRGVYRIKDPFFRFWFRYVFPNRSRLERGRVAEVLAMVAGDMDIYMGFAFEDMCRDWLGRYATGFGNPAEVGGWWDRAGATEIDIVGTAKSHYVVVGSCKWSRSANAQTLGNLKRDADKLGPAARRAKLVVFARGFDDDLTSRAEREGVRLVGVEELFAAA